MLGVVVWKQLKSHRMETTRILYKQTFRVAKGMEQLLGDSHPILFLVQEEEVSCEYCMQFI